VDATLATVGQKVADEGVRPPAVIVIGEVVSVGGAVAELAQATGALAGGLPDGGSGSAGSPAGEDAAEGDGAAPRG
jgi:uroporphyrin-III C-methyltransferase/precorrin-2 dehydrogenase/sirohydrochlorin ferrochelatase